MDSIAVLMEKGDLFEAGIPPALRAALWMDCFQTKGAQTFEKNWHRLPLEEKNRLGLILLKCYLYQPLFLRVWPEDGVRIPQGQLSTRRMGKLLETTFKKEAHTIIQIFYPLPHHQLWPALLEALLDDFFPSGQSGRLLKQELTFTLHSRLPDLRQRAEALQTLFAKTGSPVKARRTGQWPVSFPEAEDQSSIEQERSARGPIPAEGPIPSPAGNPEEKSHLPKLDKKNKKKKSADDQMKLF